jgi:hypothetical protein
LKASINIERPVKSLTLAELKSLVGAIEAEWIRAVWERMGKAPPAFNEAEMNAYAALLLGG